MKILFVSNYFNHHQKPLSDNLYSILGNDYAFIETTTMSQERVNMGWGDLDTPKYVKYYYQDDETRIECQRLIESADVIVTGSAPEQLIEGALKKGKVVFRYSERPIKDRKHYFLKYFARLAKWHLCNRRSYHTYLLCASAFAAHDYSRFFLFKNRAYKWGYFPETRNYDDAEALVNQKEDNSILWVARLIGWKHPEHAIQVAKRLEDEKIPYEMNLIGNGENELTIRKLISDNNLQKKVHLLGAMKPSEVRGYMERSSVFLFTSDHNEGWGAVLNEAMNSGCAVVANARIGSAPFLIENGKNGLLYDEDDMEQLYQNTKMLLLNRSLRKSLSINAYRTIANHWNAECAAKNLVLLAERIVAGDITNNVKGSEVCSVAEILRDDWFCGD